MIHRTSSSNLQADRLTLTRSDSASDMESQKSCVLRVSETESFHVRSIYKSVECPITLERLNIRQNSIVWLPHSGRADEADFKLVSKGKVTAMTGFDKESLKTYFSYNKHLPATHPLTREPISDKTAVVVTRSESWHKPEKKSYLYLGAHRSPTMQRYQPFSPRENYQFWGAILGTLGGISTFLTRNRTLENISMILLLAGSTIGHWFAGVVYDATRSGPNRS